MFQLYKLRQIHSPSAGAQNIQQQIYLLSPPKQQNRKISPEKAIILPLLTEIRCTMISLKDPTYFTPLILR